MRQLIEHAKRIVGLEHGREISCILHAGSRSEDGFVTFFLYDADVPICLAKVARTNNTLIENEAANLRAAQGTLAHSPLAATIDNVLDVVQVGNKLVLFKEFRPGQPAAQVFAQKDPTDSLHVFREACNWAHHFISETRDRHVHDPAAKSAVAQRLVEPGLDNRWVTAFVTNEHHFLGPTHGDLVPANILMDVDGRVCTIVDFENFDDAGVPFVDFVSLIVSTGTKLFGRTTDMMRSTFGEPGWFSDEVARQVHRYCTANECEIAEFTQLLPLYSDSALSIASRWGMTEELQFHLALRDHFITDADDITKLFRQHAGTRF